MKYKFLALLLALTLPLSACGGGDTATDTTEPADETTETTTGETTETTSDASDDSETVADAAGTAGDIVEGWYTYEPDSGLYSVQFPGEPQEQTQNIPVEGQETTIELPLAIYEDSGNRRAYMSGANLIPIPEGATFDVEKGLDGGRDSAVENTNSTIESEEKIEVSGLPGRSIVMATPEGMRFKLMMIADVDNAVLYQLLVGAEDGNIEFSEADTFFNSFQVYQ
ncbi:MAG: hypothetical protein J7641_11745 [Cyanobacteria bacterium SID2]|nr:hypothetical protein [Cyanobacteria bacterium SID2]MBP0004569.1 hypothetical protein [Cyanobacteria bacterium SBC]